MLNLNKNNISNKKENQPISIKESCLELPLLGIYPNRIIITIETTSK